ncbi:MAG: SDR family NAD(P)-dependent oxidoreductase [Sandaracinaceae bacterium]
MGTFEGRCAVITGAASGIGQALAIELAQRGANVALCDVNEDGLAETKARVEALGRRASTDLVDVSQREAVHSFAARVLEREPRVDAIINNAGVALSDTVVNASYEDLEWIIGINLWGVIHGTKAFLPHLLSQGDGWVVNLSSVFGIIGVPLQSAYNVTKFAVRGYTEALRAELHGTGVTALSVHPGGIKTNIARAARHRDTTVDRETAVKNFDEKLARTTPAQAAKTIVDAMERRAPRVLVGPDAYVIDAMQRLLPERYTDLLVFLEKRQREQLR